MTVLVIGGTGRVGSAAVQQLLASGARVRCMSHSPDKLAALPKGVEGVFADLDDPSTLAPAFEGVEVALLSIPVQPTERARGLAALDAAVASGVRKMVHISLKHYPGSETRVFYQAKQAIEQAMAAAPITRIVLRPANFFQSDSTLKIYMTEQGAYPPPIGHVGVDRIDARDVGYAAAEP